jgi:cell division protein FtsB
VPPVVQRRLKRIRRFFGNGRRVLLTGLVAYLALLGVASWAGDRSLWHSYRLWRETRNLDARISELSRENRELRREVKRFRSDRRAIERFAREQLHLAGEGEIHYIFR